MTRTADGTDGLPRLVVVTDRHAAARGGHRIEVAAAAAIDGGAPAVLLRDKDLPVDERRALGAWLKPRVTAAGALLLVASDLALARDLDADGIHLAAADPPGSWPGGLVGRSCHDRAEVAAARGEGVDYVFASPVQRTASKPGHGPALGPAGLQDLVEAAGDVPVVALGGVSPGDVAGWRRAGAHGVAVMGGVMADPHPAAAVRSLLAALEATEPSSSTPPETP